MGARTPQRAAVGAVLSWRGAFATMARQRRHLIQRGEFLTAYTPYQPEIAQGTLQCCSNSSRRSAAARHRRRNASMYDGSTACWEAIVMARRITKRARLALDGPPPALPQRRANDGKYTAMCSSMATRALKWDRLGGAAESLDRNELCRRPISDNPRRIDD